MGIEKPTRLCKHTSNFISDLFFPELISFKPKALHIFMFSRISRISKRPYTIFASQMLTFENLTSCISAFFIPRNILPKKENLFSITEPICVGKVLQALVSLALCVTRATAGIPDHSVIKVRFANLRDLKGSRGLTCSVNV